MPHARVLQANIIIDSLQICAELLDQDLLPGRRMLGNILPCFTLQQRTAASRLTLITALFPSHNLVYTENRCCAKDLHSESFWHSKAHRCGTQHRSHLVVVVSDSHFLSWLLLTPRQTASLPRHGCIIGLEIATCFISSDGHEQQVPFASILMITATLVHISLTLQSIALLLLTEKKWITTETIATRLR